MIRFLNQAIISLSKGSSSAPDWLTLSTVIKYPLFLPALLKRIRALGAELGSLVKLDIRVYSMTPEGQAQARKDLRGLGGIYIWWSATTGLFYLGSAMKFFGRGGRLAQYFMPSRLGSTMISKDLGLDMINQGLSDFTLIVVQTFPAGTMVQSALFALEQVWMLLRPTYNRTLRVGTPITPTLTEEQRIAVSTMLYSYVVMAGVIVPHSLIIHYGVKELARTGYTFALTGVRISMPLYIIYGMLKTGTLWQGILLTKQEIVDTASWTATRLISYQSLPIVYDRTNTHGVWTYVAHADPNHVYTAADLRSYYSTVSEARDAYGIPGSTFRRVRVLLEAHNGLRHSNAKLHVDDDISNESHLDRTEKWQVYGLL